MISRLFNQKISGSRVVFVSLYLSNIDRIFIKIAVMGEHGQGVKGILEKLLNSNAFTAVKRNKLLQALKSLKTNAANITM